MVRRRFDLTAGGGLARDRTRNGLTLEEAARPNWNPQKKYRARNMRSIFSKIESQ